MSGLTCSDRGQTNIGDLKCQSPADHPDPNQRGLVTYRDGRVAEGDALKGGEIGDCGAQGSGGVTVSALPAMNDGAPIEWNGKHLQAIYRIIGQKNGQTGNAYFCSNRENAGQLVINHDALRRPALQSAVKALDGGKCEDLDATHCGVLRDSLRTTLGMGPYRSLWDQISEHLSVGLAGLPILLIAFGTQGPKQLIGDLVRGIKTVWNAIKSLFEKDPPDDDQMNGKTNGKAPEKAPEKVEEKKIPVTPRVIVEDKPDFGTVAVGALIGGGALLLKSLFSSGSASPAAVPQGAFGPAPLLVPRLKSENGCERWIWEDEKACSGGGA